MSQHYDALIVGAGFSGAVLAERLASQLGWRILVVDKREHVGGNCFDECDEKGILVHRYGPHIFHTDQQQVVDYLSQFTAWRPYEHHVLAFIEGQLVPLPFNLNSIDKLFTPPKAKALADALVENFGEGARVPILRLRETNDPLLQELAGFVYEKVFLNYTTKQWGCRPEDISPEVTARVPVNVGRDDRYFTDSFQAVPAEGYTKLFKNLLGHPKIHLRLGTDFADIAEFKPKTGEINLLGKAFQGVLIYTGMVDELFGFCHGELPYRSLRFDFQHHDQEFFQPTAVVNYPNEHDFTRITEFKHLSGQKDSGTSIVYEYPQPYDWQNPVANIPYYPVFAETGKKAYEHYEAALQGHAKVFAVGRLAQYRYLDMDDAVAEALGVFSMFAGEERG